MVALDYTRELPARAESLCASRVYFIAEPVFPGLKAVLDRLMRRAEKLDLGDLRMGYTATPGGCRVLPEGGVVPTVRVEIYGSRVKLDGWQFCGTLVHLDGENLLRTVPGTEDVPAVYRTAPPACDHCRTNRRRNDTYIVRNEAEGTYRQVGSSCLEDFMGHKSADALARFAALLVEALEAGEGSEGSEGGGGWVAQYFRPLDLVARSLRSIRAAGWVSRATANDRCVASTADMALWATLSLTSKEAQDPAIVAAWKAAQPTPKDSADAVEALAWAASRPVESDFDHNLSVCGRSEVLPTRASGVTAYIAEGWRRAMGEANAAKKASCNEHFGTVGARSGFRLEVVTVKYFDSAYGTRAMVRFSDEAGRVAVWWTGGGSGEEFEALEGVQDVTATVKEHGEYQGTLQTVLTRVVLGAPKAKAKRTRKAAAVAA